MSDTPATPGTTKAAGAKKVGDLEALLSAKSTEIETLKGQVRTLSSQKEKADSLAKRNGLIAIIAAIAAGLLAFLFIAANSATGQAASRIGDLQGQLEACNKKPPPAPVLPAAPVPATGNNSCVTQETHVTVNGQPAPSPSVKIEKKKMGAAAPISPAASAPKVPATSGHTCTFTNKNTGKVYNLMVATELMEASNKELSVPVTTGPQCRETRGKLEAKANQAGLITLSKDQ